MERYEFELIPVPSEALMEIGLIPGAAAEAFVDGRRIIIQKAFGFREHKAVTLVKTASDLASLLDMGQLLRRMPEGADDRRGGRR